MAEKIEACRDELCAAAEAGLEGELDEAKKKIAELESKIEQLRAGLVNKRDRWLERDYNTYHGINHAIAIFDNMFPPPPPIEPLSVWRLKGEKRDVDYYSLAIGHEHNDQVSYLRRYYTGLVVITLVAERFRDYFEPVTDPEEIARAKAWICEGKREEGGDG